MLKQFFVSLVLCSICFSSYASAGLISITATADPNSSPDGNSSFSGPINLWSFTTTGGSAGSFHTGVNGWGMYANSGNQATSTSLTFNSLAGINKALNVVGEKVSLTIDHGSIQSGGSVGVYLLNSSNAVISTVFFNGGQTEYQVTDATGSGNLTGVGYNSNAFTLSFELTNSTGGYKLGFNNTFLNRTLAGNNINKIAVFNNNAGSGVGADMFFNNVTISAVPEPSSMALLAIVGIGSGALVRFRRSKKAADVAEIAKEETVA